MIITTERTDYGYHVSARGALRAGEARDWLRSLREHLDRQSVRGAGFLLDARGLVWDSPGLDASVRAGFRLLVEAGIGRSAVLADTARALFELRRLGQEAGLYDGQRYLLEPRGGAAGPVSAGGASAGGASAGGASAGGASAGDAERTALRWVAEGCDEQWPRQSERRAELTALLDTLGEALLLCDLQGRALHVNGALDRLLADDAEGPRLRRELAGVARGAAWPASHAPTAVQERELRTAAGAYRLRRSALADGVCGPAAAVLVSLHPLGTQRMTDGELHERYALTGREIEVARELAAGRTNAEIAARLGISPFTARNHTERVLGKLRVPNRASVARALTAA